MGRAAARTGEGGPVFRMRLIKTDSDGKLAPLSNED